MADCEYFEELISSCLDGQLTPDEAELLRAHLEECPDCAALMRTYSRLFSAAPLTAAPAGFTDSVMKATTLVRAPQRAKKRSPIVRILAGMAACAVLAIGLYPFVRGGRKNNSAAITAGAESAMVMSVSASNAVLDTAVPAADAKSASAALKTAPQEDCEEDCAEAPAEGSAANAAMPMLAMAAPADGTKEPANEESEPEAGEPLADNCEVFVTDRAGHGYSYVRGPALCFTVPAIYVYGELPEICAGLEFDELEGGAYACWLGDEHADLIAPLMELGCPYDEGTVQLLVWYP